MLHDDSQLLLNRLFAPVRPAEGSALSKPMQVGQFHVWWQLILKRLLDTESSHLSFTVGQKADGFGVLFECLYDGDRGRFRVVSRTAQGGVLLEGDNAERYVTRAACDLQVRFRGELCGFYEGRELGYLEVKAMVRRFEEQGGANVGPYELRVRLYGVHSVNPDGDERTERAGSCLSLEGLRQFLSDCVVPGNPLVDVVPSETYQARLYERHGRAGAFELEFLRRGQTVARTPQELFDRLIGEADALGIEGFVLAMPREVVGSKPLELGAYGVPRERSSVKVKREFRVTLAACRILDAYPGRTRVPRAQRVVIHLFRRGGEGGRRLVFAGDATGHAVLTNLLPQSGHAFAFRTPDERAALCDLDPGVLHSHAAQFVQVSGTCTNLSKTRCCPIGLKNDVRRPPAGAPRLDFGALSNTEEVARGNPHFCSAKRASDAFAAAIERGAKRPRVAPKRPPAPAAARAAAPRSPSPPAATAASRSASPDAAPSRSLSPVAEASRAAELEDAAFLLYQRAIRAPRECQVAYTVDEDGVRTPVPVQCAVVSCREPDFGRRWSLSAGDPEWTEPVLTEHVYDGSCVWVGPPPPAIRAVPPPYRVLTPAPRVWIDPHCVGPALGEVVRARVSFFGGRRVVALDASVDIVVTSPWSAASAAAHPGSRVVAPAELQAALRAIAKSSARPGQAPGKPLARPWGVLGAPLAGP